MDRVAKSVYFSNPADLDLLDWAEDYMLQNNMKSFSALLVQALAEKRMRIEAGGEDSEVVGLGRLHQKIDQLQQMIQGMAVLQPVTPLLPEREVHYINTDIDVSGFLGEDPQWD